MGGDHVDYMALRPLQKQIGGEKAHVRISLYLNRPTVQSPCFFWVFFLKGKRSSVMCLTCFAQTPTLTNNMKERFCSEDPSDLQNLPSRGDREGSAINWLSWRCQRFTCGNGLFTFPHLCAYKHLHIWELHTELYAKNMNGSNPSEGKFPVILHVWNSYHIITRFGL